MPSTNQNGKVLGWLKIMTNARTVSSIWSYMLRQMVHALFKVYLDEF